ncbi:TRAP transporter substrate-binding protein DctP [Pelistega suis]|uniref:TRAP transporter substrate-binding protein DctP n=1 Tax=Pelistega suis TaxID=1631957 RepID=A0A849P879_9BURK|nr:TRAP transporter substrate-binding protein DctP [Pelistega suis]NOL52504.1 TRAP transporter substrate-binding protein DctP [Pelistega suis]
MKLTKKLLNIALGAALMSASALAQAAPQKWTMTSTWPASLELIEIDKKWVEMVNKIAGDEVKIEFFEGGSLVPSGEVFGAVESGTIQAGADWPGYWAGRNPAFSPLATHTSLFNAADYVNWIKGWGGADLYNEIYGKYGMVYLPYGVTNNEAGFHSSKPIRNLDEIKGMRLRLSGLEQGQVLGKIGGIQVSMAGQELYQSLERGVIDGAEFSTPSVNVSAGIHQVTKHWATPGWHQSASVFGVMINKQAWDALSDTAKEKLKVAADATMVWSLAHTEKRATKGLETFKKAGIEIHRMDDEGLKKIQEVTNEVMVDVACSNPDAAKVYASQLEYLQEYKDWRETSVPFNLGRSVEGPDLAKIKACVK